MALVFNYHPENRNYTIGPGSTFSGDLIIPDTFGDNELPVVGIEDYAFYQCKTLTSVIIPNTVYWIGNYAFRECSNLITVDASQANISSLGFSSFTYCTNLINVILPGAINGITQWGGENFYGCSKLETITLPSNIEKIPYNVFSNCTNLINIIIPSSVKTIETYAFYYCTSLPSITIPSAVETIQDYAFEHCHNLLSVNFESNSNLKSTGYASFRYCSKLVSINFNSIITIGHSCFGYDYELTTVSLPNNLYTISDWAFHSCSKLDNIVFPIGLKEIGQYAFNNCTKLTSAIIPDGVIHLGFRAFFYCSGLISSNIPSSVRDGGLGSSVFHGCRNLTSSMVFPEGLEIIPGEFLYGCLKVTSITLPSTVKRIRGNDTFNSTAITSMVLPEGLLQIDDWVFANCTNLVTINLPNSLTTIGFGTFSNCSKLEGIALPPNLNGLRYAFAGCSSLTSVNIPGTCKRIEQNSFSQCINLTNVTINNGVETIEYYAFSGCKKLTSLNLPNSITDILDSAFSNSGIVTINIPPLINKIVNGVFSDCKDLKTITIPSNITSINRSAFSGSGLENITIPNTVKYLGDYSFSSCSVLNTFTILNNDIIFGLNVFSNSPIASLTYKDFEYKFTTITASIKKYNGTSENLDIPYSVFNSKITSIDDSAFENNTTLKTVNILCQVSTIKSNAFKNCINLVSINLPNGTTAINNYAFYGCSKLEDIIFPKKLVSIGNYSFYNCLNISSITIGRFVTSIGDYAFANCSKLNSIYFQGNSPNFGINSFFNINQNKAFYYFYGKSGWGDNPDIDPLYIMTYSSVQATGTNFTAKRNVFTLTRENKSSINPFKNKNYLFLSATNNSLSTIFNPASFNSEDRISISNEESLDQPFASFKISSSNWVDINSNQNSNAYLIPEKSILSFSTLKSSISIGGGAVIQKYPGGTLTISSYYPEDPDALNYILAIENADQERLENSVKLSISNFIVGCKTDGTWGLIKNSCLLAGPRTIEGALVPLIGIAPTNYNFTSYDYDRKLGLLGDGASKCLKTNSLMMEYQKDNLHAAVYFGETTNSSSHSFIATSSSTFMIYLVCNAFNLFFRLSTLGNPYVSNKPKYGLLGVSRGNNQEIKNRYNKTSAILSAPSRDIIQSDIYIFSRGYNISTSTPVGPVSTARIAFYSLGLDIDLAKLDSRLKTYLDELAVLDI